MKKLIVLLVLAAAVVGVWFLLSSWNRKVQHPLDKILAEPESSGVKITAHYKYYLHPKILVLDIHAVDKGEPGKVKNAVFLILIEYAKKVKDFKFKQVEFACKNKSKFTVDGVSFRNLGKEYEKHRKSALGKFGGLLGQEGIGVGGDLIKNLKRMDGSRAFEDKLVYSANDSRFHDEWYYSELK